MGRVAHVAKEHWEDELRPANVLGSRVGSVDPNQDLCCLFGERQRGGPGTELLPCLTQGGLLVFDLLQLPRNASTQMLHELLHTYADFRRVGIHVVACVVGVHEHMEDRTFHRSVQLRLL